MNNVSKKPFINFKQICLYFIIFLCVFIPFRNPLSDILTPSIKIIPDIVSVALFFIYSIKIKFKYKINIVDIFFILFILLGFVSTVIINHVGMSVFIFQTRAISLYYLLFFVFRTINLNLNDYCLILKILNIVTYILFGLSIIEKIFNKTILFPSSVSSAIIYPDNFARTYSMFYNPNTYGAFLVIVFFINLYFDLCLIKQKKILIYIILLVSLLLSISRNSIMILFIGIVYFGFIYIKRNKNLQWKKIIYNSVIVLICSVALYSLILNGNSLYVRENVNDKISIVSSDSSNISNEKDQSSNESKNESQYQLVNNSKDNVVSRFLSMFDKKFLTATATDGRIYSISKGLDILVDHPIFGSGFGSFGSAASLNIKPITYTQYNVIENFYADNQYICILVETGILGFIIFVLFIYSLLKKYYKDKFKLLLCIFILIMGLFYNVFEVQIVMMLFYTFLAINSKNFQEH